MRMFRGHKPLVTSVVRSQQIALNKSCFRDRAFMPCLWPPIGGFAV